MDKNIDIETNLITPKHIGIIMDGNRRWAKKNNLPTSLGHKEGSKSLKRLINYCKNLDIEYLTVYAFSTENWKRDKNEISTLMSLMYNGLNDLLKENINDIRIIIYGDKTKFEEKFQELFNKIEEKSKSNTKLAVGICLNYSGRSDLLQAIKKIAIDVKNNDLDISNITNDTIKNNLYAKNIPDPDLIIRTSGEFRTSDFLTWEMVYSELYFTNTLWPDFKEKDLDIAIKEYNFRNRRFGGN